MTEPLKIVASVKIQDVDISNVEKKLANLTAKVTAGTEGMTSSAASKASSASAGSDKATASLGTIATAVAIGNIASAGILKELDVIVGASEGLQNMLSLISKIISMMVQPFVNLLMPLLMPLITLMMPMVRYLNMALKPLFDLLMRNAALDMARTNLMMAQGKWLEAIAYNIVALGEYLTLILTGAVITIAKVIMDSAGWLAKGFIDVNGWLMEGIIDVGAKIADFIVGGVGGIMDFVVRTLLGALKWVGETIATILKWLADGMLDGLKKLITALTLGTVNTSFIDDAKKGVDDYFNSIGTNIDTLSNGITAGIDRATGSVQAIIDAWASNSKKTFQNWVDDKKAQIQNWVDYFNDAFDSSFADVKASLDTFKNNVYDTLVPATNKQGEAAVNLANTSTSAANTMIEAMQHLAAASSGSYSLAAGTASATTTSLTGSGGYSSIYGTSMQGYVGSANTQPTEEMIQMQTEALWQPIQAQLMAAGLAYGNPAYYVTGTGASLGYNFHQYIDTSAAQASVNSGEYAKYIWAGEIGDAIITPQGQVIRQSPEDYIMATKNPESLAGSGGGDVYVTNHWHVSANSDRQVVELINQSIEKHDAMLGRGGYFQKGR